MRAGCALARPQHGRSRLSVHGTGVYSEPTRRRHFAIGARPPDPRCGRSGAAEATVRRGLILSNSPRAGPSHTPSSSAPSSDFARYPTPSVGRWPFGAVEPARQDSARPALPRPPEALPCSPRLPPAPRGTPHRSGACHCKRRSGEIQGVVMALWAGKPPTPTPCPTSAARLRPFQPEPSPPLDRQEPRRPRQARAGRLRPRPPREPPRRGGGAACAAGGAAG